MKEPPKFASALLRTIAVNNPALVGDALEQFRLGRSASWYWRQVIAAIAVSIASEVRRHPIITMRAIALGFAFTELMWRYVMWAVMNYDELLFATGLARWFYIHGYGLPRLAIWAATALLYGASGWIVGRASRESAPIVLVYVGIGEFLFFLVFGMWSFVEPLPHLQVTILTIAVRPIPTLCGGLWAVSRKH
jgi:hypothetical protein